MPLSGHSVSLKLKLKLQLIYTPLADIKTALLVNKSKRTENKRY